MEWISVKDRLPGYGVRVLGVTTYRIIGVPTIREHVTVVRRNSTDARGEIWHVPDEAESWLYTTVTHWAELPDPPQEDEDGECSLCMKPGTEAEVELANGDYCCQSCHEGNVDRAHAHYEGDR